MQHANSQSLGLRVAGVLFGLMAVAHAIRLLMHRDIIVAGHYFPMWASAVAVIILCGLAIWMFELARSNRMDRVQPPMS